MTQVANTVGTIGALMDLAIQAERNAEWLYDAIGRRFIDHPEVARFWMNYANEEAGHARWMENLRERVPQIKLAQPAEPDMWQRATKLVNTDLGTLLSGINTLQDAWELANEMEHGETNVIFEFLVAHFSQDPRTLAFLRVQLRDHIGHLLTGLPAHLTDASARGAVKVGKRD